MDWADTTLISSPKFSIMLVWVDRQSYEQTDCYCEAAILIQIRLIITWQTQKSPNFIREYLGSINIYITLS